MSVDEFTLVIGAFLALITVVGSTLWYAHNALRQVERACELKITAEIEKESKARHDLANASQNVIKEVQTKLDGLTADVIRKADLANWESRLLTSLNQGEKRRDDAFSELRQDMKELTSKVTKLVVIQEMQMNSEGHNSHGSD